MLVILLEPTSHEKKINMLHWIKYSILFHNKNACELIKDPHFRSKQYIISVKCFSGQGGGPVQVNPQTGQPDYSVQWVEYYRSLGMHREAEMIEQQAKANKVSIWIFTVLRN